MLVDIFYDHLLARDWPAHHATPLADYCRHVYRLIEARLTDLPQPARPILQRMAAEDWLHSYATLEGIADVLARMSRRARQPNPLAGGEAELQADDNGFAADFLVWLRDARAFANDFPCRQTNAPPK